MNRFLGNILCKTSEISDGNMSFRFDKESEIVNNRKQFLEKHGINFQDHICMACNHSEVITLVDHNTRVAEVTSQKDMIQSEVLVTQEKNLALTVLTADCQPVSFYDPKNEVIALAHCSRQTIANGLVQKICDFLHTNFNTNPSNLLIHIAPHIKKESYSFPLPLDHVSPVIAPFIEERGGLAYIDTLAANIHQLVKAGIHKENIEVSEIDTVTSKNHFSYYRAKRNKKVKDGRMATILMMK